MQGAGTREPLVEAHDLTRQQFAALLFGLCRGERTGILSIEQGRRWRRVWFVGGRPVLAESNLDAEALSRTLVQAGLVEARPMAKVVEKLQPGESLESELLSLGLAGADDLREHRRQQLERSSAAGLAWSSGVWRFEPHDAVGERIDRSLLPEANPLRALWAEVKQQVHPEEAVGFVTDPVAGDVLASESLSGLLATLGVEPPLDSLPAALAGGPTSVDQIFRQMRDRSRHLLHLLWLLETVGAVRRSGREHDAGLAALARGALEDRSDQATQGGAPAHDAERAVSEPHPPGNRPEVVVPAEIPVVQPSPEAGEMDTSGVDLDVAAAATGVDSSETGDGAEVRATRRTQSNLPELLRAARRHRMGKSFYGFLDVSTDATGEQIEAAYKRLASLWRGATNAPSLPEGARKDARDLVQAAHTVFRTLGDPARRREYDRRLQQGRAPSLEMLVATGISERAMSTPGAPPPVPPPRGDGSTPAAVAPGRPAASVPGRSARVQVGKQERARKLVDQGEFAQALPLLQQLRLENPSDAGVLADLGWATWRVKGAKPGDESAEEYLQLALTFDSSSTRALEFLARVEKEKGLDEQARKRVERLLSVDPDSRWGQAALKSFSSPDAGQARGGRRFWKRGG